MSSDTPTLRELLEAQLGGLRDLVIERCDKLDEGNTQIMRKQDITNGRLGAAEKEIASSQKAIAVLQVGYVVGGVILGAVAFWLFGKLP